MLLYFSADFGVVDGGGVVGFGVVKAAFGTGEVPLEEVVLEPVGVSGQAVDFSGVVLVVVETE